MAGTGDDGEGDASTHALFELEITLSTRGVGCWEEAVQVVFAYIGMLKHLFLEGYDTESGKSEGLAPWIYDEIKSIAEVSYYYRDEGEAEQRLSSHSQCQVVS